MVVAEFHRGINVARARHTLLDHPHRFKSEGDPQPARSKTRSIFYDNRLFPHFPADVRDCLRSLSARLFTNHNLDQSHDMDGIEKVHADNGFRASRNGSYVGYRQRRSIACKNEWVVRNVFELPQY